MKIFFLLLLLLGTGVFIATLTLSFKQFLSLSKNRHA